MKQENLDLRNEILELKKQGKKRREIMSLLKLSANKYTYLSEKETTKERKKIWMKKYKEKEMSEGFFKLKTNVKRFQRESFCPQPFTEKDVIEKFGENPICYLTGLPIDYKDTSTYQLDHFIPLALGGDSSLENLRLCHPIVNAMKRDFDLETLHKFCELICLHSRQSQ